MPSPTAKDYFENAKKSTSSAAKKAAETSGDFFSRLDWKVLPAIGLVTGGLIITGLYLNRRERQNKQEQRRQEKQREDEIKNIPDNTAAQAANMFYSGFTIVGGILIPVFENYDTIKNAAILSPNLADTSNAYKKLFNRDLLLDLQTVLSASEMNEIQSILTKKGFNGFPALGYILSRE